MISSLEQLLINAQHVQNLTKRVKLSRKPRRLIGAKSTEEGNCILPLEGYRQLLKQKGGFSGY